MIEYKCEICGRVFSRKESLTQHLKLNKHIEFVCKGCGKKIWHDGFCSQSCAARYNNIKRGPKTEEQKKKISQSLRVTLDKKGVPRPPQQSFCEACGHPVGKKNATYCKSCSPRFRSISEETRQKLSEAGRKGASSLRNTRRSNNERYFAELIHQKYNDSIENVAMFDGWDADIIIPSLKIAILWNGRWHYENIMGDLKQIQNRDKIKYGKIVAFGYMPYIITDLGKFSKAKCEAEFKRFEEFLSLLNIILLQFNG